MSADILERIALACLNRHGELVIISDYGSRGSVFDRTKPGPALFAGSTEDCQRWIRIEAGRAAVREIRGPSDTMLAVGLTNAPATAAIEIPESMRNAWQAMVDELAR